MQNSKVYKASKEGVGDLEGKIATVCYSTSLMRNQICAHSASPGKEFKAVRDHEGDPIVFTISDDFGKTPRQLFITSRDYQSNTGWRRTNLSESIPHPGKVCAFDVSQYATGETFIAVALTHEEEHCTELYLARLMDNDITSSEWQFTSTSWSHRHCPIAALNVENIDVTNFAFSLRKSKEEKDENDNGPLLAVTGKKDGHINYYIVGSGQTPSCSWIKITPPDDAVQVSSLLASSNLIIGGGLYSLYNNGAGLKVGFHGLPVEGYAQQKFTFEVLDQTTSIVTGSLLRFDISDSETMQGTDLYAGGLQGLYRYGARELEAKAEGQLISDLANVDGIQKLAFSEEANGDQTIWIVDGSNRFYYMTSLQGEQNEWSMPCCLMKDVAQVATIPHCPDQLVTVDSSGNLCVLKKESVTKKWGFTPIQLPSLDDIIEFPSYTTTIRFETGLGVPLHQNITIRSSINVNVNLNGRNYDLSPNKDTLLSLPSNGVVVIIQNITNLNSPTYTIGSDGFKGDLSITPSKVLIEQLQQIQSQEDLRLAVNPMTGEKIFKNSSDEQLKTTASLLQQLAAFPDTSMQSSKFSINSATNTQFYGVENSVTAVTNNGLESLAIDFGDLLQQVSQGITSAAEFVLKTVEHGFQFVVTIGEQVFSFAIDCIEKALDAIGLVFQKLGVAIDMVVDWLGFVFDWESIRITKDVYSEFVLKSLEYVENNLSNFEEVVEQKLDEIKDKVNHTPTVEPKLLSSTFQSISNQAIENNDLKDHESINFIVNHLQFNTMNKMIDASTNATNEDFVLALLDSLFDDLQREGNKLLTWLITVYNNEMKKLQEDIEQCLKEIFGLIDSKTLSLDVVIGSIFSIVMKKIGVKLLDTAKTVAVGALQLGEIVVKFIRKVLTYRFELPFFSSLLKQKTGVGETSLLELASYILAIPTTSIYRMVAHKAPFTLQHLDQIRAMECDLWFASSSATKENGVAMRTNGANSIGDIYSEIGFIYSELGTIASGCCKILDTLGYDADVVTIGKLKLKSIAECLLGWTTFAMTFPIEETSDRETQLINWGISGVQSGFDTLDLAVGAILEATEIGSAATIQPEVTVPGEVLIQVSNVSFGGFKFATSTIDCLVTVANISDFEHASIENLAFVRKIIGLTKDVGGIGKSATTLAPFIPLAAIVENSAGFLGGAGDIYLGLAHLKEHYPE